MLKTVTTTIGMPVILLFGFVTLACSRLSATPARATEQSLLQTSESHPLIERVIIRGNRRIPEETIRFFIQSRPGQPYSETGLEYDLRALHATSFFDNIEIQLREGDTGKIVTFILRERPIIRSIEYTGNISLTESDIQDAYRKNEVGLTVDSQYEPQKVRAAERTLKELMVQQGKPMGTVHTEIEPVPPGAVRLRFVLSEKDDERR